MKVIIKIIAYSIWFGFALWLSIYCCWLFSELVDLIEKRIIRTEFPPDFFNLAMALIWWAGFICLLAWLPIWLMKKRRADNTRTIGRDITFLILLLGGTVLSAVIWQFYFPENIYNCTDDNMCGFFRPGDWIHGNYVAVHKVVPSLSMSEPDTIKKGWSITKLWCAWWLFIVASVAISASLTFLIFRPRKSKSDQAIP